MSQNESATLILYLIEFPNKEQRYVYYWLGESRTKSPFKPSGITTNIEGYKKEISKLLEKDLSLSNIKNIGKIIKDYFGLKTFFHKLFDESNVSKLTILTNDVETPWEWLYFYDRDLFLCEKYSLGKVFVAKVEKYEFEKEKRKLKGFDFGEQFIRKMKVLLFFDKGGGEKYKLDELYEVEDEIKILEKIFINKFNLPKSNLRIIDGRHENAEQDFFKYIEENKDDIKIIHYSGHVENKSLIFSSNRIDANQICSTLYKSELNSPLVFINGCRSGRINDVWESENNIATAFLHRGASNVICTNREIHDNPAKEFSEIFYSNLLDKSNSSLSIADVLRISRKSYKEKSNNAEGHWLFYNLYGDAQVSIFPVDPNILMRKIVDPTTEDAIRAMK